MLNMIYCEFLKIKRLRFFPTLLGVCAIFPLLFLVQENNGMILKWNKYMFREQLSSSFTFILVFVVVAASLVSREFTDNTARELYSYPTTRTKIFMSKIIVTIIIIAAVYIFKFCLTIVLGLTVPHENLTNNIILTYLKVNFYIIMFQSALVPITVLIASLSRNLIVPIIYGVSLWILDVVAFNLDNEYFLVIPSTLTMVPMVPLDKYNSIEPITASMVIIPQASILAGVITFVVGIALCVLYYKKADIA